MSPKRPQDKPAEEKLKIVMEAETVAEDQLGAFLRATESMKHSYVSGAA